MISEELQDQAALYALELLDADEAAAFEYAQAEDGELRALAGDFSEAVAELARTDTGDTAPPAGLRERVLAQVAREARGDTPADKIIPLPPQRKGGWFPWAAAAALVLLCALLGASSWRLSQKERRQARRLTDATRQLADTKERAQSAETALVAARRGALTQVSYCVLEPVPAPQRTGPQAAVLWDAVSRRGRLQIHKLPPPGTGKDYQLWTVEAGHKNPISAGLVRPDPNGEATVDFQPGAGDDAAAAVGAFALSVERAGGAENNEGPILFLGKLGP